MFNLKYDQSRVRKYHYFMLLSLIQKHKKISRSQLAERTKMSHTSVGKIIKELIRDELVIEVGQTEGDVGRRAALLEINPEGSYIIGVEVEWQSIQIGLVALNGHVLKKKDIHFTEMDDAEKVLACIADEIELLTKNVSTQITDKIIAVGVSIPGLITWPEGEALIVPQFHWENIKVKSYLENRLDYIVYVDNHVRTVLLAESLFGSMAEHTNSVCVYIGSGLGGAVLENGEILRGHMNTLGEIGHMIMEPDGLLCDCGRLGCLQTYICSSELEKQTKKSMKEIITAYKNKEQWAIAIIERARKYVSIAIANIICMYNPQAVLLAGPMLEEYPVIIDGMDQRIEQYIWSPLHQSFVVEHATMGKNSGIIGASALVLNEFLRFSNDDINIK